MDVADAEQPRRARRRIGRSGRRQGNDPGVSAPCGRCGTSCSVPPRTWIHHSTTDLAILADGYGDLLPPGVRDHLAVYWQAWLHPEIESRNDIPNGGRLPGGSGPTYFRGYSEGGGTQNFNHNAIMGTLLASQYLGAENPLREAQRGLEGVSRSTEGVGSVAYQELGDTFYLGLTLSGCGVARQVRPGSGGQRPGPRTPRPHGRAGDLDVPSRAAADRLIPPCGRPYYYDFLYQEGPHLVLHSLSPQGVLMHLDDIRKGEHGSHGMGYKSDWGSLCGLPILGDESRPQRFAQLGPGSDFEDDRRRRLGGGLQAVSVARLPADFAPDSRPGWHVELSVRPLRPGVARQRGPDPWPLWPVRPTPSGGGRGGASRTSTTYRRCNCPAASTTATSSTWAHTAWCRRPARSWQPRTVAAFDTT